MSGGKESHRSRHRSRRHHHHHHHHDEVEEKQEPPPPPPQYGTFQGVANYPPPPVIGFPQPVPPPGASDQPHYAHGYQAVLGYAVAEGTPVTVRERRLPCCGIGLGWFMSLQTLCNFVKEENGSIVLFFGRTFIIGFLLAAIPWYIAAFILLCAKIDPREKPGYVTCIIAAVLATIAIILGVTKRDW